MAGRSAGCRGREHLDDSRPVGGQGHVHDIGDLDPVQIRFVDKFEPVQDAEITEQLADLERVALCAQPAQLVQRDLELEPSPAERRGTSTGDVVLFEQQGRGAGLSEPHRRRETGVPRSDHDHVDVRCRRGQAHHVLDPAWAQKAQWCSAAKVVPTLGRGGFSDSICWPAVVKRGHRGVVAEEGAPNLTKFVQ